MFAVVLGVLRFVLLSFVVVFVVVVVVLCCCFCFDVFVDFVVFVVYCVCRVDLYDFCVVSCFFRLLFYMYFLRCFNLFCWVCYHVYVFVLKL